MIECEPVICDPFCGSGCLSRAVPCNTVSRLLCASRSVTAKSSRYVCGHAQCVRESADTVPQIRYARYIAGRRGPKVQMENVRIGLKIERRDYFYVSVKITNFNYFHVLEKIRKGKQL